MLRQLNRALGVALDLSARGDNADSGVGHGGCVARLMEANMSEEVYRVYTNLRAWLIGTNLFTMVATSVIQLVYYKVYTC